MFNRETRLWLVLFVFVLNVTSGNAHNHFDENNNPYPNSPFFSFLNRKRTEKIRSPEEMLSENPFLRPILSKNKPLDNRNFYEQNDDVQCGTSLRIQQLIVNGDEFAEGAFPWLAAVFSVKNKVLRFICGGTLISERHVLTAGHCVVRNNILVDANTLAVLLGKFDLQNLTLMDRSILKVKKVHIHPDYKLLSADGDVAVLELNEQIIFNTLIRPACLWDGNTDLQNVVGHRGTVAGWGKLENGIQSLDRPRQIRLPIVSQETCLRSQAQFVAVTSNRTFCAGSRDGSGPCSGDSGSGFLIDINGQYTVRGIVSLSLRSDSVVSGCDLSAYVIFADISKFLSWMYLVLN